MKGLIFEHSDWLLVFTGGGACGPPVRAEPRSRASIVCLNLYIWNLNIVKLDSPHPDPDFHRLRSIRALHKTPEAPRVGCLPRLTVKSALVSGCYLCVWRRLCHEVMAQKCWVWCFCVVVWKLHALVSQPWTLLNAPHLYTYIYIYIKEKVAGNTTSRSTELRKLGEPVETQRSFSWNLNACRRSTVYAPSVCWFWRDSPVAVCWISIVCLLARLLVGREERTTCAFFFLLLLILFAYGGLLRQEGSVGTPPPPCRASSSQLRIPLRPSVGKWSHSRPFVSCQCHKILILHFMLILLAGSRLLVESSSALMLSIH